MFDHKIIITGPVGSGKSTAIRAYSTTEVVSTDVYATDQTSLKKNQTTVAMDYGNIILDEETKVHLYGTPGQERFDFMWEILSKGSRGIIILVNASSAHPAKDLQFYMQAFDEYLSSVPMVIGVNYLNEESQPAKLRKALQKVVDDFDSEAEIIFVDVRKRKDMNKLVKNILFSDKLFAD